MESKALTWTEEGSCVKHVFSIGTATATEMEYWILPCAGSNYPFRVLVTGHTLILLSGLRWVCAFLRIYYALLGSHKILGDPAAATITTQPPIHKHESETDQICALVRNRLYYCTTTHPECGQSNTSGTEAKLPTRVLYVKNATSYRNSIKLVQTYGATGAYCALSHCWGPPDRQPIRTLAENIQDHYSGIPLTALPRTFQEAVILTQRLGIDYLWIDSLCIQQDDNDDWGREAASMGQLYQQATLVIAASGSEDPTGGLFICERSPKISLKLPYPGNGNQDGGAFNMAFRSPSMRPLDADQNSPLQERAWALQESYLSRRIVLFRESGIDWRCLSCQLDEYGCYKDLGLYEHSDWFMLLGIYSRRKLTWPSDRLPALQGIVSEEGRGKGDTFLSEGVWEKEIPEHLLWYAESDLAHGDSALPSWSWAATEGPKAWICKQIYRHELQYDYSCVVIKRTQPAHLSVSGDLVQGKLEWAEMSFCCMARCEEYLEGKEGPLLELVEPHLLQSEAGILGFGALDPNEEPSSSTDHSTLEFCILSKMKTSGTSEKPDIAFREFHKRCLDVSLPRTNIS